MPDLIVNGVEIACEVVRAAITAPEPKTIYAQIAGRSGDVDLTTALTDGTVPYDDRDLTLNVIEARADETAAETALRSRLGQWHGQIVTVSLPPDPWRWEGRCRLTSVLARGGRLGYTMAVRVGPYRRAATETKLQVTAAASPGKAFTLPALPGDAAPVIPSAVVTGGTVTVVVGTAQAAYPAGSWPAIELLARRPGGPPLDARLVGSGSMALAWREGRL
ncbi:MAG: hypothetical protein LBK42_13750 [Propionibacteriaceae bacterium]|jgi:hypothetical protein|nr:hypothetical protein [Propionibacteriaceae bacterium]